MDDEIPSNIILFLIEWDDDIGPVLYEIYPNFHLEEDIIIQIFSVYQLYWEKSDNNLIESRKLIIPIKKINKKCKINLSSVSAPEYRGGRKSFIVGLLFPDYFKDNQMKFFDEILNIVSSEFKNNNKLNLSNYYHKVENIIKYDMKTGEKSLEFIDGYSYTAAIEDFQAAVNLFKSQNFKLSLQKLNRAIIKFKNENNKYLMMESYYMIGSIYSQQKDYINAFPYYQKVFDYAKLLDNMKYIEIGLFMIGFCLYKIEKFKKSNQYLGQIDPLLIKYINKMQYFTIYGRVLGKLKKFDLCHKLLLNAVEICDISIKKGNLSKYKSEILYDLGENCYNLGLKRISDNGLHDKKSYQMFFEKAIDYFFDSIEIIENIGDTDILVDLFQIIGNIFHLLGNSHKSLENFEEAYEILDFDKDTIKKSRIFLKIIQILQKERKYDEINSRISEILPILKENPFIDLLTLAKIYYRKGYSLYSLKRFTESNKEYLQTLQILDTFKKPIFLHSSILKNLMMNFSELNDKKNYEFYKKRLEELTQKDEKIISINKNAGPMGEIKEIWIFYSTSVPLFKYSSETDINVDLAGGFLSALQSFSLEINQKFIDSFMIGNNIFTLYQEKNAKFFILARSDVSSSEERIKKILAHIYSQFWKKYDEELENFFGDTNLFNDFDKTIENLDLYFL